MTPLRSEVGAGQPAPPLGHMEAHTENGVTIVTGHSIEARAGTELQLRFNGRTYYALADRGASFRVVVPAFKGHCELWRPDKQWLLAQTEVL